MEATLLVSEFVGGISSVIVAGFGESLAIVERLPGDGTELQVFLVVIRGG